MTARRRPRVDSGWFLVGQIVLAALAALSPALGAREGVSSVLPPLRAEALGPVVEAVSTHRDVEVPVAGRRSAGRAAVVACLVAAVAAARRSRATPLRPSRGVGPRPRWAWSRPPGRAPPLAS